MSFSQFAALDIVQVFKKKEKMLNSDAVRGF